jgi:glycosyltransferase involved in cell wall biosynthesis
LLDSLGLREKTVLGFIGSFYAYEGIPLLLDGLSLLLKESSNISLLLVGGGPEEGLIKAKIRDLGLDNNVVLTGRVPHDQVQSYYNLVDVFVYPRLSMRLTDLVTPLKPLEAFAQGRLVVASDVGGHKELIEHGKTGYLFEADSAVALAETVLQLLAQKDRWPEIHTAARKYVEQDRSWEFSVARYGAVYGALM